MRAVCVGGGPAGLYFAIALKRLDRRHEVLVVERNRPDDTFGWGVVFSDQTMDVLGEADPESATTISGALAHWDDIDVHFRGQRIRSGGHGFSGIGRKHLLNILQQRCRELDVELRFECEASAADFPDVDLIVASDGINSATRAANAGVFRPSIQRRANKFIWLGTEQTFDAFAFVFLETEHGWIWAHAYRFEPGLSTFIVECSETTWRGLGFEHATTDEAISLCERLFAPHLNGHRLMSNARHLRGSAWLNFPVLNCERWHHDRIVLIGDAAHSAHFSVGSGTKLALEDAIGLASAIHDHGLSERALDAFQATRGLEVIKLQNAARNSTEWFEHVPRYVSLEPIQFAYSLLTRSQRISHENLRLRDPKWLEGLETWFVQRAGVEAERPRPPMFAPLRLRGLTLSNRIVVSPMSMYSAVDGMPGDFHLVHYGSRAQGGAALVVTEMTDVSADARITPGCAGLYSDEHERGWKRIVDFVHAGTDAKIALQLGHAGPKGSTKVPWEGEDQPLDEGNWPLIAPSAIPWSPLNQIPREMTEDDMEQVIGEYVRATIRAIACGFDMIEIHSAHGYLLSAFLTPAMNKRTDRFGGAIENRLRFPLIVFDAVRRVWPDEKPISVRISATDWLGEAGNNEAEALIISRAFADAGADVVDVSAGQTSTAARPVYGRMFQTPFSDLIRNEAGVATMAVGNIYEIDHVNSILAAGRADLCCLARPHLTDPYWTLRAAAQQGYDGISWPKPYWSGRDQLVRNLSRAR
ncbi:MAG TPA: bifunctional salicylyl-CoA 5-hydroxylase/oxidoreductase [Rhizomicrobium sp.]|nr:bifunctional salicylyl-CoA 5-hydroxylase/oxidoreductase [Rhizomicrobium sp.]